MKFCQDCFLFTKKKYHSQMCLVLFFIYPALKEIYDKSREFVSEKQKSLIIAKEIEDTEAFKQKYQEYRENLDKIDGLFIDVQNPVEFIKFLENTAEETSVRLEISSPSFVSNVESPLIIFKMSSYGDFLDNLSFIKKLEAGPYLIKIQNLDIGRYQDKLSGKKQTNQTKSVFLINVFAKK